MADEDVHPQVSILGTNMDRTGDPDLECLRIAAAKAQDAASKFQTQATSLRETRSSSSHSNTRDHRELSPSPLEMLPTNQMAEAESFNSTTARDNHFNERGSREDTSNTSAIMASNHHSSPGDSALGESLSGTEELVRQPSVTTPPSILDATTPMADSASNQRPQLISQQESFGPRLSHGVKTGSDGLIGGEDSIEVELDPPQALKEFMGERSSNSNERRGILSPEVFQTELLHTPEAATPKPKRRPQPKPPRLPENTANDSTLNPSFRHSLSTSARNLPQTNKGRIPSGSNISHDDQEKPSHRVRPFSRSDNVAFVQVFKSVVHPNIKASESHYGKLLSKDVLFSIGKLVADEVVTKDFQYWVRENSYKLSNEQQKEIEEFISASFSQRVSQFATIDLTSTVQDDVGDGSKKSKSVKKVASEGLSLDPFAPSSSQNSTRLHASNDLSLLGPGQPSESTPISAQIRTADDLSLLGPGQVAQLIDPATGFKRQTANPLPFSNTDFHDQSPGTSRDISLASVPCRVPSGSSQDFDLPSFADEEDLSDSRSASSYAQRKQLLGENSRTSKRSAGAVSQLEIVGDLGHDTNASVLSLDGNYDARQCRLSKDKLGKRQRRSYREPARNTSGLESNDTLPTNGWKTSYKVSNGKKPSLRTSAYANDKTSPYIDHDSTSAEDGEEVLATWLSLDPKATNPYRTTEKLNGFSESLFNSLNTSDDISVGKSPEITSSATDLGDVPCGLSSTSYQKNNVREIISSRNASVDTDGMAYCSNDQPNLTSNVSKSLVTTTAIRGTKESAPCIILKFKIPQTALTARLSERLRSRPAMTTSQVHPDALEPVISRGNFSSVVDPSLEQTIVALANNHSDLYRPYRSHDQNVVYSSDSHNTLKHVDFSEDECEALLRAIYDSQDQDTDTDGNVPVRARLKKLTQGYTYEQITELIGHVHADKNGVLRNRKRKGIRAFFSDLKNGLVTDRPGFIRVEVQVVDPAHKPQRSLPSLLRHRELGSDSKGGRFRNVRSELRVKTSQNILPWRSWKRASGDVVTCAWAPNSLTYAVGAAAPSNNEDLQYNRPQNLLLGDLSSNLLQELPDHRVERPQPNTIPDGPNSTHEMYNNLDPMIYMTISSVQFSRDGSKLITASHDKTAKVFDTRSSGTATCLHTLYHDAMVTCLDVSPHSNGLFATASKTVENSIRVYSSESLDVDSSMLSSVNFSSSRAQKKPNSEIYPECLRWGKTPNTSHILLAGFHQWGEAESDSLGREGEIYLWDVRKEVSLGLSPSKAGVLTAAWHPTCDMFAVGGVPGSGSILSRPRTTRSVVRTWDMRNLKRYAVEYECPALDMQDVTFNPLYPNIVTAGCTDSATYVWDFRWPDQVLLKLQHDKPLLEWDHTRNQEEADPGVMMTLWGLEGSYLYTGSSDGIVKCWDTSRAHDDALVRNVADVGAGIQSGAFSPDFSHLLVGDSDGAVHVLTSAPVDRWHDCADSDDNALTVEPIKLIEAQDPNRPKGNEGILAARKLLQTGQLVLNKSYGVGKGPNYSGPYARYARREGTDPAATDLLPQFDAMQPFSRYGQKRREIARRIEGVICGRKELIAHAQESKKSPLNTKIVKHEGRVKKQKKRARNSDEGSSISPKKIKTEIIDLTHLLSDDGSPSPSLSSRFYTRPQRGENTMKPSPSPSRRSYNPPQSFENLIELSSDSDFTVKGEVTLGSESLEETDL